VKAPLTQNAGALRAQAQSFSARFVALQAAGPNNSSQPRVGRRTLRPGVANPAGHRCTAAAGRLVGLGFVSAATTATSSTSTRSAWNRLDQAIAGMLPQLNWERSRRSC